MAYEKPLPTITEENREFWEALKNGELRLQQCSDCLAFRYPIAQVCPRCLSDQFAWNRCSGHGTIFSFVIFHQVYHPAFKNEVPYNVALVELDEGVRMISNIVGIPNEEIQIGAQVQVLCDQVTEEMAIPRFRPIKH